MQAVRSVRSGHRAVRPRTTRVDNRGPLAQRGSAAVIQAVQKRPLASKGVAKAHAKSIRAKLGVRFDARPRAARAHRPHSHNVATQDAAASGRIQTQCRYIPNAARTSADTARPCRIPMHLPPRPGCRPPFTQSPCAARGTPPRRPPATRPGWRPSPWRW